MKNLFLITALVGTLVLGACDQTSINDPVAPASGDKTEFMKALDQLQLTDDQLAQMDVMFYLDEDMSTVFTPKQERLIEVMVHALSPRVTNDRMDRRRAMDIAAMMYYRLIIRANQDLPEETKLALRELIATSNQTRLQIIAENRDNRELLKELLAAEHASLIAAMNALLTPEQLLKVQELKDRIERDRKDRRDRMIETRIDHQVAAITKWLGLSDEQAVAIKQILLSQYNQIEELRAQYAGNPEGFRTALHELQVATNGLIAAQLTPEQLEKWNGRKRGGMGRG